MVTNIRVWKIIPKHVIFDKIKYIRQDITEQLEVPIYDTDRLDSILDSSKISILNNTKTPLNPLTRIIIDIVDESNGEKNYSIIYRVVDNDTVTNVVRGECPLYRHTLDLLEPTKITERHIVDNLTFTNYLPKNYGTLERAVEFTESEPIMNTKIYSEDKWTEEIIQQVSSTVHDIAERADGTGAWLGKKIFRIFIRMAAGESFWDALTGDTVTQITNVTKTIEHITITGFFPKYVNMAKYKSGSGRITGPFVLLSADNESETGYSKTIQTNIELEVTGTYASSITDDVVGATSDCSLSLSSFTVTLPNGEKQSLSTNGNFTYRQEGIHKFEQVYTYWLPNSDQIQITPAFEMRYVWEVRTILDESSRPRKYNMEQVVDRILRVFETRQDGLDSQKFTLDNGVREYLRSIEAPEFSISQGTLFEALQQVGQYIHAIPRLIPKIHSNQREYITYKDVNGNECFAMAFVDDDWSDWSVITFDFLGYGKNQEYKSSNYSLIDLELSSEEYATDLLSNVQNATATNYDGIITMTEPFEDGFLSTRTESTNFEISDNECIIRTRLPIRSIVKVEAKFGGGETQDITAFVVESAIYNIKKEYNVTLATDAKWLHLYYTEGQPNIKGLSLVKPTSNDLQNFGNKEAIKYIMGISSGYLKNIIFRVTYIPFVNFKAKQYKTLIKQSAEKSTLFFNQQAHEVDVEAYGRNMNATLLKTGNIKLSKTQYFESMKNAPKIGQWHSSGYFAFLVSREISYNAPIKVSTAWSKNYNEMNANVAIKSNYRQYEISEKESTDRNLYKGEFCVVDINLDIEPFYDSPDYTYYQEYVESQLANVGFGQAWTMAQICRKLSNLDEDSSGNSSSSGGSSGVVPFWGGINDGSEEENNGYSSVKFGKISAVGCIAESTCADPTSENYGKTEQSTFIVPVATFPFGNSIVSYFSLDDNYSAGTSSEFVTATYNEEQYIRYGNTFGRFDKLHLIYTNKFTSSDGETAFAQSLYKWSNNTNYEYGGEIAKFLDCIVDKDSRECIGVTAQLNFVTPNSKIMIGPALPATLPLVGDFTTKYRYVVFKKKQNHLADEFEGEVIMLNMPPIGYTTKTKHICISENSESNHYSASSSSSSGTVGSFVAKVETPTELPLGDKVGEGYGIVTTTGRICVYVEGIVYENSLLPAIYLMFRRNI